MPAETGVIRPKWSIRKWYLDCVEENGDAWIGYWGDIRWRALHARFESSLVHAQEHTTTTTRVRASSEPDSHSHGIRWSTPSLGVHFELKPVVPQFEMTLAEGVVWRCAAPKGQAIVQLPDRMLRGHGYAEVLEMSVAPWSLPIRELRWGRAIGERTSLVWIEWRGASPLRMVLRDGVVADALHMADDEMELADGTHLTLTEHSVLREDSLANTLRPLRAIAPLLPPAFQQTIERKWRSRATITMPDRPREEGWAIHERLTFAAD